MSIVQNKKKATIGIAVAAVGAAAIALGAGTFAAFTSTGDGNDTTAAAATLQLNESTTGSFDLENFVPGGPAQANTLSYTNAGSVPGDLTFSTTVDDVEDGCVGDEALYDDCATATAGDLSGLLQVTVTRTGLGGDPTVVFTGTVADLAATTGLNASVPAGTTVSYDFSYQLPEGGPTDNAVQGDSATVTTTATLSS